MIDSLEHSERSLVLRALIHSVRTNTGDGFRNHDQCHPAYAVSDGSVQFGDSPQLNSLYKLMLELSQWVQEHPTDFQREDLILSWDDFCKMAVLGYQSNPQKTWPLKSK